MSIIDTRDLAEELRDHESEVSDLEDRIEELENELCAAEEESEEWHDLHQQQVNVVGELEELRKAEDEEDGGRIAEIRAIENEISEFHHGQAMIPEDEFVDWARQEAESIHGDEMRSEIWPFMHIDWEAAADALKQDYTEVELDGDTYLVRNI